ncbi:MAG: lanthionine synthetase LanC family protein, partial [Streptosporangiaceae bacterium]
ARLCADRLAGLAERTDGRCADDGDSLLPGFATGPAGIGWALARFAATVAEPRYRLAGQRAVRYDAWRYTASSGWCRGAAGLLVARGCLDDEGLDRAVEIFAGRPVPRDLSLCHGELGSVESLGVLAAAGGPAVAPRAWRHRTGLVLSVVKQHARFCGTPGGADTPGLLDGLAGIGYGLLRLGFAERVPSVLFVEPTPTPNH